MDALNGTDLALLHTKIAATSAAAFPGTHFEFYREDRNDLPPMGGAGQPTSICLLELTEMDPGEDDPGTEQVDVLAKFEAQFIIGFKTASAKVAIRALAASFAAFLRKQLRWPDVLNGEIQGIRCYKDDFSPELDQYEIWTVEWTQVLRLGVGTPWLPSGTIPTIVLASFVPLIGIPYEYAYVKLEDFSTGVPPAP